MTLWLRGLAALHRDLSSIPSIHAEPLMTTVTTAAGCPAQSSGLLKMYAHIHAEARGHLGVIFQVLCVSMYVSE